MTNYLDLNAINLDIIKCPIITDKSTRLLSNNQYSFVVSPNSDKPTIKSTIEIPQIHFSICLLPATARTPNDLKCATRRRSFFGSIFDWKLGGC